MKKYLNVALSAGVAVLTFLLFLLPTLASAFGTINGYETITFKSDRAYMTIFGIAAIVMLIAAIALAVLAVLEILKKANVLKVNFDIGKILKIVLYVATGAAVLALIANIVTSINLELSIGAAMIIIAILYIAVVVTNLIIKDEK